MYLRCWVCTALTSRWYVCTQTSATDFQCCCRRTPLLSTSIAATPPPPPPCLPRKRQHKTNQNPLVRATGATELTQSPHVAPQAAVGILGCIRALVIAVEGQAVVRDVIYISGIRVLLTGRRGTRTRVYAFATAKNQEQERTRTYIYMTYISRGMKSQKFVR